MLEALISRGLDKEARFKTSRSSGKGGQNVNKLETRVELWFDIAGSALLGAEEKEKLLRRLDSKLVNGSELHVQEQSERTQLRNKELAIRKLNEILAGALKEQKPRKATRPKKSAVLARLKSKKIASERKERRRNFF